MVGWMEEVRKREEENRKCGGTGKEQELRGKAREQKVSEGKTFVKICVSKHSNTFKCELKCLSYIKAYWLLSLTSYAYQN